MLKLYNLILYLFFPVLVFRLCLRGFKNQEYWQRWPERFGFYKNIHRPYGIWVHAVSVGEVNAAAPLINTLLEKLPTVSILITTMTPTGSDQVLKAFGGKVDHVYVPYDYPGAVKRFWRKARPELVIIMETEIWPNIINRAHLEETPLVYANVRMSERSFKGYSRIQKLISTSLKKVSLFFVQTPADATRLIQLGAQTNITHITGSIKFDIDLPASSREIAESIRSEWGRDRSVLVAGSTHEGEDEQLLAVYDAVKKEVKDLLLVLVPRHPERFDTVVRLTERAGYRCLRRSQHRGDVSAETDIYIGDTMGELATLYAAADVAFVGGSLLPIGGHNLLEPCGVGVPVVFGPYMFNFQEISQITVERGAGLRVRDQQELIAVLLNLFRHPDARFQMGENGARMLADNKGALNRSIYLLKPYLSRISDPQLTANSRSD